MHSQGAFSEIVNGLQRNGFSKLDSTFGHLIDDICELAPKATEKRVYVKNPSIEERINRDVAVQALLRDIQATCAAVQNYDFDQSYTILRTVDQTSERTEAYLTHYDSTFLHSFFHFMFQLDVVGTLSPAQ